MLLVFSEAHANFLVRGGNAPKKIVLGELTA